MRLTYQRKSIVAIGMAVGLISTGTAVLAQDTPMSEGIATSVVKAPIVPDGDVAGAPADFVINLDTDMDPAVPGRTLLAGNTIRVTLPEAFGSAGLLANLPTECAAFAGECNTAVLLQVTPERTVKSLLSRLVHKGALGYRRRGKRYRYRPLVALEDCVRDASRSFVDRVFGGAVRPALLHFVRESDLSPDEIAELERLLDNEDGET